MPGHLTFTNIASLAARRRLDEHSLLLARTSEKLSSGQRINRASDDAAGLAIASSLRADSRVYNQGLRNANDAISALNIAEGSASQLQSILVRLRELATSAANGVFSLTQRKSLDTEAFALTNEYNRIAQTARFNGRQLISGGNNSFSVQIGYGNQNSLGVNLGGGLARTLGTGAFNTRITMAAAEAYAVTHGDVNGDGFEDLVNAQYSTGNLQVFLGNGSGNFGAGIMSATPATAILDVALADMNGDGSLDIVQASGNVVISFNQGNGTFGGAVSFADAALSGGYDIKVADINKDGRNDIVTADAGTGRIGVFLNNGSGASFSISTISLGALSGVGDVTLGDFNEDGKIDIIASAALFGVSPSLNLFLGNGNGSFQARQSFAAGIEASSASYADLNHDGHLDLAVATRDERVHVMMGNGNGTFGASVSYVTGTASVDPYELNQTIIGDVNGDGVHDLVVSNYGGDQVHILLGRGDGTFLSAISYTTDDAPFSVFLADLNNDGASELVTGSVTQNSLSIFRPQTESVSSIQRLDLLSRESALSSLSVIEQASLRVATELGNIGSMQSRLLNATQVLSATRENYLAAESRISSADIAQESANLVRASILQQSAAAVTSQANFLPELLLQLLSG